MRNPQQKLTFAILTASIAGSLALAQTAPERTVVETVPNNGTSTTVRTVPSETTTTTTTTNTGLISEITPEGLVIRTDTGAPVRYFHSSRTEFVDDAGRPVSRELVTSGLPVTVRYVQIGDRLVAERVIVRRQAAAAQEPTVIERNTTITRPPVVVEKPVIVEKRVPVPVEKKVYVDRPVIVEKPVVVEKPAPAPVIIEKKTTTTTTTTTNDKRDRDKD